MRFPRDRYDPSRLTAAFSKAEIIASRGDIYAKLDYEQFEIYFPGCESLPVPAELREVAERACKSIRVLDNLVQESCQRESDKVEFDDLDDRYLRLHIGYLKVFENRVHIRYWGYVVNTEWEAEFDWDALTGEWKPLNF